MGGIPTPREPLDRGQETIDVPVSATNFRSSFRGDVRCTSKLKPAFKALSTSVFPLIVEIFFEVLRILQHV